MLEQSDACKLLKHGLVVQDNKQTVGEIDYLIELPDSILHLEVAIKFYAGVRPAVIQLYIVLDWPKLQRSLRSENQSSTDSPAQTLLYRIRTTSSKYVGSTSPQSSLGLIYGYLIQPWQHVNEIPQQTKQVRRAFWTTHSEALGAMRHLSRPYSTDYGWTLLERDQWIAPYFGNSRLPQVPRNIDIPVHADCYALQPKQSVGEEKLRLFIMPDTASPKAAHLHLIKGLDCGTDE